MNEPIEPLARMAGIDGAVPKRSIEQPTSVLLDVFRSNRSHQQPFRLFTRELSELGRDIIATAPMAARTSSPSHFA
jgi:hypothetical protein